MGALSARQGLVDIGLKLVAQTADTRGVFGRNGLARRVRKLFEAVELAAGAFDEGEALPEGRGAGLFGEHFDFIARHR